MFVQVCIRLCYQINYHNKLGFFRSVFLWYILKILNEFLEHLSYVLITESLPTLGTKTI